MTCNRMHHTSKQLAMQIEIALKCLAVHMQISPCTCERHITVAKVADPENSQLLTNFTSCIVLLEAAIDQNICYNCIVAVAMYNEATKYLSDGQHGDR